MVGTRVRTQVCNLSSCCMCLLYLSVVLVLNQHSVSLWSSDLSPSVFCCKPCVRAVVCSFCVDLHVCLELLPDSGVKL